MKRRIRIAFVILGIMMGIGLLLGRQSLVQAEPQVEDFKAPFVAEYYPYHSASSMTKPGTHQIGWNTEDGKRYYMKDESLCYADGIANIENKYYYFDADGYAVSGWIRTTEEVCWGMHSMSMYFDEETNRALTGYHKIDGIGRYFNEMGFLSTWGFHTYTFKRVKYVEDKAGIVSTVTPMIPLIDAQESDIPMLKEDDVIDGDYEFQAQVAENTIVEPFGFSLQESQRIYGNANNFQTIYWCIIPDESLKGKIGAWYRNAGVYHGRSIDAKFTITDYTMMDLFGKEYGTLGFHKQMIGIAQHNLYDTTCEIEFYDHETQERVTVKGFATIDDIDSAQGCEILSPYDNIYISDQCELLYGSNNGHPVFADDLLNYKVRYDNDPSWQVIVNYTGDSFSFKLYSDGSLWKNDLGKRVYAQGNMPCFSEQEVIDDYKEKGVYSWQGYLATRFARVTTPTPAKNVIDSDEDTVPGNLLSSLDEEYCYKISHNVPLQNSEYYYSEYKVTDPLEPCLQYVRGEVCSDTGKDVTDLFSVEYTDHTVTFVCKDPQQKDFYGKNYHFKIYVKIDRSQKHPEYIQKDQEGTEQYIISNKAFVHVNSAYETSVLETNDVTTVGTILWSKGDVRIHHTDQGTGKAIEGVTFSVFEWSKSENRYQVSFVQNLVYSKEEQYYYNSQPLIKTEENEGKFKIVETESADRYMGKWEKEIQITCAEGETEVFESHVTDIKMMNLKIHAKIYAEDAYAHHGNPTFLFQIEGTDANGEERRYVRYVTFTPAYIRNNKQADGTVQQSTSIFRIPAGRYTIKEKKVSRYVIEDVTAVSNNMIVKKKQSGHYYDGIQPIEAEVVAHLLVEDGEVLFVNRKITWDQCSHNDLTVNYFSVKQK